MQHTYAPLKNILNADDSIGYFNTSELQIDLGHPLTIDCQPSYDGTVNLIINDDKNPPRMINTRFTRIEDNRYRIITRNQLQQTNLYRVGKIDQQTRLLRNLNCIPKFDLVGVKQFGCLSGGNYTFYLKYADADGNETDVAAETGQISIFHGDLKNVSSMSGTLVNERTDKAIMLKLSNIDTSFSRMYLYYTREYCDQNGIRQYEAKRLSDPYPIKDISQTITITGYENVLDYTVDELNIMYSTVHAVKTQAQVQNRLFFGNIQTSNIDVAELQNTSYYINVSLKQSESSVGYLDGDYQPVDSDDITQIEYYSPQNIYYNLGYWPDEMYRLGIVYILNDDSLTPVFNLRGCEFTDVNQSNVNRPNNIQLSELYSNRLERKKNYLERDTFITNGNYLDNTWGVFKNPKVSIYKEDKVLPLYYEITLSDDVLYELKQHNIKGYFIVRQKRIPTILAQGLAVGIDKSSYIPMIKTGYNNANVYTTECFLNNARVLSTDYESRIYTTSDKQSSALISVEVNSIPTLQSQLDGSQFVLEQLASSATVDQISSRHYVVTMPDHYETSKEIKAHVIFVNTDVPLKWVKDCGFSTRAGSMGDVKTFGFFHSKEYGSSKDTRLPYVRGIYCPIVGTTSSLLDGNIYNIRVKEYSPTLLKEYIQIRGKDTSPFYAISDRFALSPVQHSFDVYRGDCYSNTVTVRINRNFVDSDVPINETIVDSRTWKDNYKGYLNTTADDWGKINRADLNTVPMGMWITYKCLSSYNLGLRSLDRSYPDEEALLGNPRGFYPVHDMSTKPAFKIAESGLLNDGYGASVGRIIHNIVQNVPYINDLYDNRVMFSNAQIDSQFKNSYRIFQGLSYGDIDRQYGAIVKFIPWDTNLFCAFEHGLAILPINEKALIQTTTGQSIHMYGAGVIQNQVSLISSDFGSIWQESIIQTPIGIYGVDTYAKKIWRFSKSNGFEIISDMRIQRFLNDNILLREDDKYPTVALRNVKSHYNNYKGDVMFTFYNYTENAEWNFCFNERMNKWITRYSWTPLYSENINNSFYSLDKKRAEVLSYIYDNRNTEYGIHTTENQWSGEISIDGNTEVFTLNETFSTEVTHVGHPLATDFTMKVDKVETSYLDDSHNEIITYVPIKLVSLVKQNNKYKLTLNKSKIEKELGFLPLYFKIFVTLQPTSNVENTSATLNSFSGLISIIVDDQYEYDKFRDLLCNGFYLHGRAGIVDEIDYFDDNPDNQIKPTYWYDKQEPFEFEFVVNTPIGLHKIFNNLIIISNNVQPKEFEFEIIGDVYEFKKSGLYKQAGAIKDTSLNYDHVLNQYTLVKKQECKNIEQYGRRLGNIQYKEDSWYTNIEPIICNNQSARIRDKFIKIRVRYSGEDQVIITALKTLFTLSYS